MLIDNDIQNVHENIYYKLKLNEDVKKDEADAKLLTNFLKSVKMNLYTNPDYYANASNVGQGLTQYLRNETARIFAEDLLNTVNGKGSVSKLLFTAEKTDHSFEKAFAYMQQLAYKAATDMDISEDVFRGGQEKVGLSGTTNAKGNTYLNLHKLPDEIAKMTLQQLQTYFGKNFKDKQQAFIYFNQVEQKIDNKALSFSVQYQANLSPYARRIYNLLLSKNFSLKNYFSAGIHDLSTETLEIGDTTLFRSIVSSLQYSGLTFEEAVKYFYRGISAIEYHNDGNIIKHFNHLKNIYEYTGAGQKIYLGDGEWQELHGVDFLVYNDPSSTEINVYSIKSLLQKALNEVHGDSLQKNISYTVTRGKSVRMWRNNKN